MSGHSRNPIFFNKKKTGHPEGSTTPLPPALTSDNISLLPEPPTPLKMDVICISPLKVEQTEVISGLLLFTFLLTNYKNVWLERTFIFS